MIVESCSETRYVWGVQLSGGGCVPLAAVPLEAVDVQDHPRLPRQAREKRGRRVDRVADEHGIEALEGRVDTREGAVHDRVKILRRDRGQHPDLRAAPVREARLRIARPRVHRHVVAPRGQPRRELLRQRLETAVSGRDAAGAEDADAHALACHPEERSDEGSRTRSA